MRVSRIATVAALTAASFALASPASAEVPEIVTVEHNPWVVCVTEPCEQEPLFVVCVVPADYCLPVL